MFITFEGCEGVGKSTQLKMIKDYAEQTGQRIVFVREPGGTEISEQIRKIILSTANTAMTPVCEALLYAAARAQLVNEVIRPALDKGLTVICDRYIDSSVAYQGYARGLGAKLVKDINAPAVGNCMPDYTVFINLHPSQSFRTIKLDDRFEHETALFHEKVYEGFIAEAQASPERFIMIKPDLDRNKTGKAIINALKERGALK